MENKDDPFTKHNEHIIFSLNLGEQIVFKFLMEGGRNKSIV